MSVPHASLELRKGASVLVREATVRLARRIETVIPLEGSVAREDTLEELELAAGAVLSLIGGDAPSLATAVLCRPGLDTRLLHALRAEALREPSESATPTETLEAVRAIELAIETIEPEEPEDLKARLMAPDAFELLVEVAHDLRSPLTSILFLSETLRGGHSGDVNDVQRSQLGLIYSAALGLVSVVSDVVDLARGGRGLLDTEPSPYSLSELFRGLEEMVRPMAEEKGVEFRLELPAYDRAHGYPVALSRIILNLTTNALKFTDCGFVEVGATRRARSTIEFYVRDTGRGIDPAKQQELFQPFKKARQRDGHFFSGSGLGLSIARRLIRSMGSELDLQTRVGWGTRFSFTVPDRHSRTGCETATLL